MLVEPHPGELPGAFSFSSVTERLRGPPLILSAIDRRHLDTTGMKTEKSPNLVAKPHPIRGMPTMANLWGRFTIHEDNTTTRKTRKTLPVC